MSVDYYSISSSGAETPKLGAACFANMNYDGVPVSVRYPARINGYCAAPKLTLDEVKAYDLFLHQLFDTATTGLFTSVIETDAALKTTITYVLKTEGMKYKRALVYLTAMRYIDEFPGIVQAWAQGRAALNLEASFSLFCALHKTVASSNLSGHGLMYPAYEASTVKRASVSDLRANLKRDLSNVTDYFVAPPAAPAVSS